jgi:hypothetical protein
VRIQFASIHCAALLTHSRPCTVPYYLRTADRALCRSTCTQLPPCIVPQYLHTAARALCRSTCTQLPVHCAAVLAHSCHTFGALCDVCWCSLFVPSQNSAATSKKSPKLTFRRPAPAVRTAGKRSMSLDIPRNGMLQMLLLLFCCCRRPCAPPSVTVVVW